MTGQRLFKGDDDRAVVGNVLKGAVDPPSERMGSRLVAGEATLDQLARLDEVTLRGLAPRPEHRFESARAMAVALEKCVGIVPQAEVGEWVDHVAGDVLRLRAQRVAEIESQSSHALPIGQLRGPEAATTEEVAVDGTRTELSSSSAVGPSLLQAPPRRRRALLFAVGGATGLLLVMGLAFGVPWSRTAARPAAAIQPTSGPGPIEAPPPGASSTSTQEAPTAAAPATATVASADAGTTRVPRRPATPPPNRKLDCDPPYTLDSSGHQHFKERCFH